MNYYLARFAGVKMCVVEMQDVTIFGMFNAMIVLRHFRILTQRKKHLKLGTHAHQNKEVRRSENIIHIFCDQCGVNKDSHYTDSLADYLLANGVIVPPEYTKIVRCSECENLKLVGTNEKYAHCEKYGFDFLPFKADTRGHFCVQYK